MGRIRSNSWSNWAGNQTARPVAFERPNDDGDVAAIVRRAHESGRTVKAVGTGHSFTSTALTSGHLVLMDRLRQVIDVDRGAGTVTVGAGITIGDLNEILHGLGLAMPNLGDIAYQTISGAIATSTHGTGARLTGLAGQVRALRLVTGTGEVVDLSPADGALFDAARVNVGALGIVTQYTLGVVPAFRLRAVEGAQKLDALLGDLDTHVDGNDHFEFFWLPHTKWALTKRNNRTDDPVPAATLSSRWKHWYSKSLMENYAFGALCELGRRRPSLIPRLATALPSSGQSTYVNDSFRIYASKRIVKFLEMEYSIPREHCAEALSQVRSMIDRRGHLVSFPVEVRFTAADDIPLSTAHGRPSAYIAVHMYKGTPWPDVERYFRDVEEIMVGFGGRPHWGKMHFRSASDLEPMYPRWAEFRAAREKFDPDRVFANDYLRTVLGA
jgi:FAD-linked oxidoreductase